MIPAAENSDWLSPADAAGITRVGLVGGNAQEKMHTGDLIADDCQNLRPPV
jgi:hypothetical protein